MPQDGMWHGVVDTRTGWVLYFHDYGSLLLGVSSCGVRGTHQMDRDDEVTVVF